MSRFFNATVVLSTDHDDDVVNTAWLTQAFTGAVSHFLYGDFEFSEVASVQAVIVMEAGAGDAVQIVTEVVSEQLA